MLALLVILCVCVSTVLSHLDYEAEVNGRLDVRRSVNEAYKWLMSQRKEHWGWGTQEFPETHRALTALYFSGKTENQTESLEYQLSVKELELELSLALRLDRPISAGQLGLYANSLLATCRNPNDFYKDDIIKMARQRRKLSLYAEALVSLAVCNSGSHLTKREIVRYLKKLENYTDEHSMPDTKAMIVLALSCVMKSERYYRFLEVYLRHPLKSFVKSQAPDGSFGNIYSSALVIQALIAAGHKGEGWDFNKGIDYILSQQNEYGSFSDLLGTYFVLPVLAGKSLASLRNVHCRAHNHNTSEDLEDKELRQTILVRYSVWGNTNISEIFIVPENSTFYDVMKIAINTSDSYRFSGNRYSWGFHVKKIGNLANDEKCKKYWLLYKVNRTENYDEPVMTINGVEKEVPENGDHYIFWYKKLSSNSDEQNIECQNDEQYNNTIQIREPDALTTESSVDSEVEL